MGESRVQYTKRNKSVLAKEVRSSYWVQTPGIGKAKQKLKRDTRACQSWPVSIPGIARFF
jgi:hypothetical protein